MDTNMDALQAFTIRFLELSSLFFAFCIGLGFLAIVYMYIVDRFQTKQTIRRNYPVVGRFRYLFEH